MLIVDDDAALLDLLAHALTGHGFEVRVATTAEHAVVLVHELDPHVAVLDLHLGVTGMDGHALGVRLLAESTRRLQLIVLTGDDRFGPHARTESLGFAAHLVKPVQLRDLARLLEILVPWARD